MRSLAIFALLAAAVPAAGDAQESALTKAELVALLSTDVYSASELATMVRANCLSFVPTAADLGDLSSLGASDAVIAEVASCGTDLLYVTPEEDDVRVTAGGVAEVRVRALRGDRAVGGLYLEVTGVPTVDGTRLRARTDGLGEAAFAIPAGSDVRSFRAYVRAPGTDIANSARVTIDVVPGRPRLADVSPSPIVVSPALDTVVLVTAALADRFGNPIAGRSVTVRGPASGNSLARAVSDGAGVARLSVRTTALPASGPVDLVVGGQVVGEVAIEFRAAGAAGPAAVREGSDGRGSEEGGDDSGVLGGRETAGDGAVDSLAVYEEAVVRAPRDMELRRALARYLDRTGRRRAAEAAWLEILADAPDDPAARRGWFAATSRHYPIEAELLGGVAVEPGGGPGVRAAFASYSIAPDLRIWGRYDHSLGLEPFPLPYGPDEWKGVFVGAETSWGEADRLSLRAELGRRSFESVPVEEAAATRLDATDPVERRSIAHTTLWIEQSLTVPTRDAYAKASAGVFLAPWWDHDEWGLYGRGVVPLAGVTHGTVAFEPALHAGRTVGWTETAGVRTSVRELRFVAPIAYRSYTGWLVRPGVSAAQMRSEEEALSGWLTEIRLLVEAPVLARHRFRLFGRYETSPGRGSFGVIAAGLRIRLD